MLLIDLARIITPGLLIGIILGKFLVKNPDYLKLLHPSTWIDKAKNTKKRTFIKKIFHSLTFALLLSVAGLITGTVLVNTLGPIISQKNIFTEIRNFSFPILIISITLIPVLEEWVFRGIVLEEVREKTKSNWKGLILSSFIFAIFHLTNPGTQATATIFYFVLGLVIGGSYLVGGLFVAITCHIIYNLSLVLY